jgi:hypothetical protein
MRLLNALIVATAFGLACSEFVPPIFTNVGQYSEWIFVRQCQEQSKVKGITSTDITENGKLVNQKTYYLSELKLTWIEAFLTCRSFGLNLWHFDNRDEWENMGRIFRSHKSLFDSRNFIGATRLGKNHWYWSHSGEIINPRDFDWGRGEPGGTEFCTDMYWQNDKIVLNDYVCRDPGTLYKFLCVDVLYT